MAHHVEHKIRANTSAQRVWEVLKDFGSIERSSTSVKRSPILEAIRSGVGTKRKCYFYDGKSVVEEIKEYEEGRRFKMVISEFSMPLKSMFAELKVEEVGENICDISMSMDFVVKGGPLGWLMGFLIMRPVMKIKVLRNELIGLAYHAATGKVVGDKLPPKAELDGLFVL